MQPLETRLDRIWNNFDAERQKAWTGDRQSRNPSGAPAEPLLRGVPAP